MPWRAGKCGELEDDPDSSMTDYGPVPTQADFKAYGQWAFPRVNGVYVDNASELYA
jgi:hypothetical protein